MFFESESDPSFFPLTFSLLSLMSQFVVLSSSRWLKLTVLHSSVLLTNPLIKKINSNTITDSYCCGISSVLSSMTCCLFSMENKKWFPNPYFVFQTDPPRVILVQCRGVKASYWCWFVGVCWHWASLTLIISTKSGLASAPNLANYWITKSCTSGQLVSGN